MTDPVCHANRFGASYIDRLHEPIEQSVEDSKHGRTAEAVLGIKVRDRKIYVSPASMIANVRWNPPRRHGMEDVVVSAILRAHG